MFPHLADFAGEPEIIMDIGSGYGVPGVWLLEIFPRARLYGIEPDPKRVRFAARVIGARGFVRIGKAPDMPDIPDKANLALLIDVIHHLDDDELRLTLKRICGMLCVHGTLVIRVTVPSEMRLPWWRWIEMARIRIQKGIPHFRSEEDVRRFISQADFEITLTEPSAPGREEWWFVAKAKSSHEVADECESRLRER
jgi:trans-aconitate methyltransferase